MLYHIVNYDHKTKIAGGILASYASSNSPSGLIVSLISEKPLQIGQTYSFKPQDKFHCWYFTRGELDYSDSDI